MIIFRVHPPLFICALLILHCWTMTGSATVSSRIAAVQPGLRSDLIIFCQHDAQKAQSCSPNSHEDRQMCDSCGEGSHMWKLKVLQCLRSEHLHLLWTLCSSSREQCCSTVEKGRKEVGGVKSGKKERSKRKTVEGSDRRSRRCCNAGCCYHMTLTGLCNQTGLAFGSQQAPAALPVI